jgi:hypothetical protein
VFRKRKSEILKTAVRRSSFLLQCMSPLMADIVEKVESSAALQNCQNDIEIFNRLKLPGQIHLELATFVELRKMRSPTSVHLKRAHEAKNFLSH